MKTWNKVVDLLASRPGVAMLVGASDTGKTTLAVSLTNQLLATGVRVAVVDGDIGQSDLGPPGTVGMGIPEGQIERMSDVPLHAAYFVGSNSPEGHSLSLLVGASRMIAEARARGAQAVILDTTGLVQGRAARVLKHFKFELIRPDYVLALQRENELESLLRPLERLAGPMVIRVRASARAQSRSRHQRKLLRERALRAHLAGGRLQECRLDEVSLLRTIYRTGRRVSPSEYPSLSQRLGCPVVHAEWIPEGLYLVLDGSFEQRRLDRLKEQEGVEQIFTSRVERLRELLVGLTDGHGNWLGIGVLTQIDFSRETATIFTKVDMRQAKAVHVGILRVTTEGEELGKIFPNDI